MDELRAAVRELAEAPSAEQADALVERLARTPPSNDVALFITQTLELAALHEVRDSRGVPVRWRLIDRLLALGFPHALHVTPEDLDYHRLRSTTSVPAALTVATSFLTALWCFLWGALALGLDAGREKHAVLAVIVSAIAHAIAALLQSFKASRGAQAPWLKRLGWAGLFGPLVVFLATNVDEHLAVPVFVLGLPSMITALLCAITASRAPDLAPLELSPPATEREAASEPQLARAQRTHG